MKKTTSIAGLFRTFGAALLLAGIGAAAAPGTAQAQAVSCTQEPTGSGKTISQKIQKTVIEVQEILEAGQYAQAIQKLGGIGGQQELDAYDRAVINQLYAQAYIEQDNYEEGVKYLERVVQTGCGQLPLEQINQMIFNIGQLYIAVGADKQGAAAQTFFKKGIATMENWFAANPNARPDAYATLSTAYLQIDPPNYSAGIKWLLKAIDKSKELGEEPREGWYRNLAGLYIEIEQTPKAVPIVEMLIAKYPKRDYFMQMAYVYGEVNREKEQFEVLEAAYHNNMLESSQEFVYLAQLYISNGIPIRAAAIMESGLDKGTIEKKPDHYRFLADALYTAKQLDSAIKWYKVAGQQADNAGPAFFLGQIYMQKEDWQNAIEAFEDALRKDRQADRSKKLSAIGTAHFNLGIAYYTLEKCGSARTAFGNARGYDSLRSSADQWLRRIEQERKCN